MDNKEIQRQRMITYFVNATKEIVMEEGVKGLSVRKVGDRAGYSYATIYNYFNDLKTLLTYCALDFLDDCYRYMLENKSEAEDCRQQILNYTLLYMRFFVKNPNIFQLVFLEELGQNPEEHMKNANQPSAGSLLRENLKDCAQQGLIAQADIDLLQNIIGSSIHGKLLFFIKNRGTEGFEELVLTVKKEMDYLMKASKEKK